MAKGWLNLEAATDNQLFEQDSAFKFLGLSRTQRVYGFVGWSVHTTSNWFPGADWLEISSAASLLDLCCHLSAPYCYSSGHSHSSQVSDPFQCDSTRLLTFISVLYALGTIISLVGTGFLIGVSLNSCAAKKISFSPQHARTAHRIDECSLQANSNRWVLFVYREPHFSETD